MLSAKIDNFHRFHVEYEYFEFVNIKQARCMILANSQCLQFSFIIILLCLTENKHSIRMKRGNGFFKILLLI